MSELFLSMTIPMIIIATLVVIGQRVSIPFYPLYFIAGIITGLFVDTAAFTELAGLGIIFLIFTTGLRARTDRLYRHGDRTIAVTVGTSVLMFGMTVAIVYLANIPLIEALLLGLAAAIGSTLASHRRVDHDIEHNLLHGQLADTINLTDDIIACLVIAVITGMTTIMAPGTHLIASICLIITVFMLRDPTITVLNRLTGKKPELLMVSGTAILFVFIAVAEHGPISPIIAAFTAGILLSKPIENNDFLDTIQPPEDFFLALSFLVLGAMLHLPTIETVMFAGLLTVMTTIITPLITTAGLLLAGYDTRTAIMTGLRTDQISEFVLVMALIGEITGTIGPHIFQAILIAFAVTSITTSLTARYSEGAYQVIFRAISPFIDRSHVEHHLPADLSDHLLLLGYGNTNQVLASQLELDDHDIVVIDYDPEAIENAKEDGRWYVYGDLRHDETWETARPDRARLIISTIGRKDVIRPLHEQYAQTEAIICTDQDKLDHVLPDHVQYLSRTELSADGTHDIVMDLIDTQQTPFR